MKGMFLCTYAELLSGGLFIIVLLQTLVPVAYITLYERKVLAAMQRRRGPNAVGFWGVLQPLADGLKLMAKEGIRPWVSIATVYEKAPFMALVPSFLAWLVLPLTDDGSNYADNDLGFLVFTAITTLGSFGVVLAGWGSFSRYAMMGALRAIAQLISYEVVFLLTIAPIAILTGSFSFFSIVNAQAEAC